ncbi:MAG: c-type cytochrome [Rhodospirillales bacterium]
MGDGRGPEAASRRFRSLSGAALGLGLIAAAGLIAVRGWNQGPAEPAVIDPSDPRLVAEGAVLYAEHCASCHGRELEGEPDWQRRDDDGYLPAPPHDSSGHTWHHADEQLFAVTKHGVAAYAPEGYKSRMTGFGEVMTDRQIRAVLAFIKSTWPARERTIQERISGRS